MKSKTPSSPSLEVKIKMEQDIGSHEETTLLETMKSLLEKERKLMEIKLLEKDREIEALKFQTSRVNEHHTQNVVQNILPPPETMVATFQQDMMRPLANVPVKMLEDRSRLENLRVLDLRCRNVNERVLRQLVELLPHLPNIKVVDLSENDLGESCAETLGFLLSPNSKISLQEINLSNNRLGIETAQTIARSISRNSTLHSIDLSTNPFQSDASAGTILGEAFGLHPTLQKLRVTISDPKRDRASGTSKSNSYKFAKTLLRYSGAVDKLGLVGAHLARPTIGAIARHGVEAGVLRELDLSYSFIGPSSMSLLAQAICKGELDTKGRPLGAERKKRLEKLVLRMNDLGVAGCYSLGKVIKHSKHLRELDVSSNCITGQGARILGLALASNQVLQVLALHGNPLEEGGPEGMNIFVDAVEDEKNGGGKLFSVGDMDRLNIRVSLKRRLLRVFETRKPQIDEETTNQVSNDANTLLSLGERMAIPIKEFGKYVEAVSHELSFEDQRKRAILLRFHANADWKLVRVRQGGPTATIEAGQPAPMSGNSVVVSKDWMSGDVVKLYLRPKDVDIDVMELSNCVIRIHGEKEEKLSRDREYLLQRRDWLVTVSPQQTNGPWAYFPVHEVFIHILTRTGVLQLEWQVSLQTALGQVIMDPGLNYAHCVGVDWRICKNDSPISFVSGGSEDCCVLQDNRYRRTYMVKLREDQLMSIGDKLTLWLRPSTQFVRQAMMSQNIIYIHCHQLKLSMLVPRHDLDLDPEDPTPHDPLRFFCNVSLHTQN